MMQAAKMKDWDWSRICVLVGDVAEKYLGLSAQDFFQFAGKFDVVIHCAAHVNTVAEAVEDLIPSNTLSVVECLRLKPRRFVYISSAGVLYPFLQKGLEPDNETTRIKPRESYWGMNAYSESKLLGEFLCFEALDRGFDIRILRPSTISPHPRTGHANPVDRLSRTVLACLRKNRIPEIALLGGSINLIPVDFCAQSVVRSSLLSEFPEMVNVVSQTSTKWSEILESLNLPKDATFQPIAHAPDFYNATTRKAYVRSEIAQEMFGPTPPFEPKMMKAMIGFLTDAELEKMPERLMVTDLI
jgi:thioester reductase-like protein